MSRKPLDDATFRRLKSFVETSGYFETIIGGASDKSSDGSAPSRPSSFFDPPSGVKKKPKAKPKARNWTKAFERCVERGRVVMGSGEAPQNASDLVGLYAVLHEHVFAVLPLELQQDYAGAVSSADKLVRDEFAGDYAAAERFVAWCWKRVRQSSKRKKADGEVPFRPGWRIQFKSRSWLTDFKAAVPKGSR